jgi:hypothetical protein
VILVRNQTVHQLPADWAVASRFRPRPSPSPLASEWRRHAPPTPTGRALLYGTRMHVELPGLHSRLDAVERRGRNSEQRAGQGKVLESVFVSPNKPMQRAGIHKVLGRGRSMFAHSQVCRARVLSRLRAVADGCRSVTSASCCLVGVISPL